MTWRRSAKFSILALFLRCSPGFGQLDNCTGTLSFIGDGWCDPSNNNPSCNYDGGDCCECTCVEGPQFTCGSNGYDCVDADCVDPGIVLSYPECTGSFLLWGDGTCDGVNNNPDCGYDGGDCCICTCGAGCSLTIGDDCLDPSAGDELYGCEAPPLTVLPCSSDVQRSWVVDGSTKAQAFAEAVNCSGGEFSVEWNGDIIINKTIYIMSGTVLNVTGAGSGAGLDGGSLNRLFTVINATLYVTNLSLRFGSAIVGGAIATSASQLTLNNVSFIGNEATGLGAVGGAVFVTSGSNVNVNGKSSIFSSNTAVNDGGALYVSGTSVVSFTGSRVSFVNNTAGDNGGAIAVRTGSHISWDGEAIFYENKCERYGGAVDVLGYSSTIWRGVTSFFNNTAGEAAGALMIRHSSCVEMYGDTAFTQNNATLIGGTVFVVLDSCFFSSGETVFAENYCANYGALLVNMNSTASWSGQMTFIGNSAESYGGALAVEHSSNASWSGRTTFTGNHAIDGGALFVSQQSSVSWTGQTTFIGNNADWYGGALAITYGSNASWNGSTIFTLNHAYRGAALYVFQHTSVSWSGPTTFTGNHAYTGGALCAHDESSIFWSGRTAFLTNHAELGGALFVFDESSVSWSGDTTFAHNTAVSVAGAFGMSNSCTWWSGPTEFLNNSIIDSNGSSGAIYAFYSNVRWTSPTIFSENQASFASVFQASRSNISWSGETEFNSNRAEEVDGASSAGPITISGTNIEWSGKTLFFNNSANGNAGMIFIFGDSDVCWRGETSFIGNRALYGGGVIYIIGSNMSWSGRTRFINNSASLGGAIHISNRSRASWSGETVFLGNIAQFGGSLWISDDAVVHWTGITRFAANKAEFEGGVVQSIAGSGDELSALVIAGPTLFSNNTSGANGGALSIFSGISLTLETTEVVFLGNSAQVSGGAVFLSGADIGPTFEGVRFESNSAQIGGAVYATSSGNNKINVNGVETQNPTVFNGCTFVGNAAGATGGAVQTAAGHDIFFNTSFLGNMAGVGGALRLAGTAEIEGCLFEDNVSDEEGGPAVSNIGYISSMVGNSFVGNVLSCPPGTYLDYNESNDLYEAICDGCDTPCQECFFDEPAVVPICKDAMDHSVSPGGLTTLERLSIDRRYWRATNVSLEILECYNPNACRGGLSGSPNYCLEGYEGPYCAICSDGYTASIGFSCQDCSNNIGGLVLAIFLSVVCLVVAVAVVWYLTVGAAERETHGLAQRILRYIPLQSLKIIIVVWQILTQFASVANVAYPDVYQRFLDGINVLNFDFAWILSAGCIVNFDFHDRLLFSTIGPLLVTAILAVTYTIAVRRNRESPRALERAWHRHLSAMLFLTFLVYSSVSSILFQTFACEHLDDGKYYLRADYRIECDSVKHEVLQIYAGFMVIMYPLGIPALYAALLFKDREMLKKDEAIRSKDSSVHTTSSLWKPYKPSVFYYEVIECGRRILLTGVVVFIYPSTAAQIAITLILAFAFAMISEVFHPYVSIWDTWISRAGHIVVFVSMYIALLLKVDVYGERTESQGTFEIVLVSVHGCLIAAVLVEALVLAKRVTVDEGDSEFPMRRKDAVNWNKTSSIEEVDCPSGANDQMVPSTVPVTSEHKV